MFAAQAIACDMEAAGREDEVAPKFSDTTEDSDSRAIDSRADMA